VRYYVSDSFPFVQGPSAGPFAAFPGDPRGVAAARAFAASCRRVRVPLIRGLGAFGRFGDDDSDIADTASGMIAEGFSPSIVNSLVAAGVSNATLQSYWNNYDPNDPAFAVAATSQIRLLTGQPPLPAATVTAATQIPQPQPSPVSVAAARPGTSSVVYYPYPGQSQPQPSSQLPSWVLPVAIGGGILLIFMSLRRR